MTRRAREIPVTYVVFDVLHLDGQSLLDLSYDERREHLESLGLSGGSLLTGDSFRDVAGADVLAAASQLGLEGIVAKRRDAPYRPGQRSDAWLKVKKVRTQEVVIGGWTEGNGERSGEPRRAPARDTGRGRAALCRESGHRLRRAAPAATCWPTCGRSPAKRALSRLRSARPRPRWRTSCGPFSSARSSTVSGPRTASLRHPSWRGLRPDKDPAEVIVER